MSFVIDMTEVANKDYDILEEKLMTAIEENDIHLALFTVCHLFDGEADISEEWAMKLLIKAQGIAGGRKHSPHIVTEKMDREAMVKAGLFADLGYVSDKRREAMELLERIEIHRNGDGALEFVPVWND
jgi:hypothetical protein